MEKETLYSVNSFIKDQRQTNPDYWGIQKQIKNAGYIFINHGSDRVKIYTAELAIILFSKEIAVRDRGNRLDVIINGGEYLNTYIEAYKEGMLYFETTYKDLAGPNAKLHIKDIHLNFFHTKHNGVNEGWGYVKSSPPLIISHKIIKEYGYYSGIVSKVEDEIEIHQSLFAAFDKCEHELQPGNIEDAAYTKTGTPKTFADIFYDNKLVTPCIEILKKVTPHLVDADFNYIGKSKGAFCVWIYEMQRQGIVKHYSDRKIYASLIPTIVKRLTIDESMFGKPQPKAEKLYQFDMKTLISQVKLSQNSQKGKLGK